MIVCICKFVSDRQVRAARDGGADTLAAVSLATGAGTGCGCCHDAIEKLLAEAPCKPVPCAGCPSRAEPSEAVPFRAAAERLKTP